MGTPPEPRWIRIYADDIAPGDLVQFTDDGDAVRVIDRDRPPAWALIFRVRLDGDDTAGLSKAAKVRVFDPDGSVSRRVRVIIPEEASR